ncbi:MAG: leucyl/phenylalanyl-tRNA--protein transferase [Pseudomonadota bacterium]
MRDEGQPEVTADLLLQAYAAGVFPMAERADTDEIFWIDPKTRGILPLDGLHMSRSLRKTIRQGAYEVRWDSAFAMTVSACANRPETWINERILKLYDELFRTGFGHSVEVYMNGRLAGGLYGVAIGSAFFGESMFSLQRDASKIALVYLVARLRTGGFQLLDTQFVTDHLMSLGALEISRANYHARLARALPTPANYWALRPDAKPDQVLQAITQTS